MSAEPRIIAVVLVTILLTGCQSPILVIPGKLLQGEVRDTDSFAFAREFVTLQLEVNPAQPYSVNLRVTVIDDVLYIDAAKARRWHEYLRDDNRVRIRLGGFVYPATAVLETSKELQDRFLPGRLIYRIEPRKLD